MALRKSGQASSASIITSHESIKKHIMRSVRKSTPNSLPTVLFALDLPDAAIAIPSRWCFCFGYCGYRLTTAMQVRTGDHSYMTLEVPPYNKFRSRSCLALSKQSYNFCHTTNKRITKARLHYSTKQCRRSHTSKPARSRRNT